MNLSFKPVRTNVTIPSKATKNSAGWDLFSPVLVCLHPGEVTKIYLGFCMEVPEGYFALFRDKSSIGSKGIIVVGGVVDSDYRDELILCLLNCGKEEFWIREGKAAAQMLILPNLSFDPVSTDKLDETERKGGFGSTGK